MSSGYGSYSVSENEARLERTRQAAVQRSRQIQTRLQAAQDAIAARRVTGKPDVVSVPKVRARPSESGSAEDHNRWADEVEGLLRVAESALATAASAERAANLAVHLRRVASSGEMAVRFVAPLSGQSDVDARTNADAESHQRPEVFAVEVAEVIASLSPHASSAEQTTLEHLAERAVAAAPEDRRTVLTELKFQVQRIGQLAAHRLAQGARAQRLLRMLDGIEGAEADDVRDLLQRVLTGEAELLGVDEARVATVRARAIAEEDRVYVLTHLAHAFAGLGYQVDGLLATAPSTAGVAYAFLPDTPDHAVELRLDQGRYDYRLVRTTATSDPARDAELEQGLCKHIGLVTADAHSRGIHYTLNHHRAPGSAAVPYVAAAGAQRPSSASSARLRERKRPR